MQKKFYIQKSDETPEEAVAAYGKRDGHESLHDAEVAVQDDSCICDVGDRVAIIDKKGKIYAKFQIVRTAVRDTDTVYAQEE